MYHAVTTTDLKLTTRAARAQGAPPSNRGNRRAKRKVIQRLRTEAGIPREHLDLPHAEFLARYGDRTRRVGQAPLASDPKQTLVQRPWRSPS